MLNRRFIHLLCISLLAMVVLAMPALTIAQGDLPVPREETIFLEDTPGPYQIFDSFNDNIPNGNEFANGYIQIGREYLFLANFASGEFESWQAESFEYNDDFTQMTLHLKDNVMWNDGQPFTSADVVYTMETIKANEPLGGEFLRDFDVQASAPDATTVVMDINRAAPRFHYNFFATVNGFEIWPKHIWENEDPLTFKNNPPVTTSVWKLRDVNQDLRMFIWERDENYWNKDERFPAAKYVIYRNAPASPDADYQEFVTNVIDHAHAIDWFQIEQAAAENPAVTFAPFQDPCPRGIWINTQKYPLSLSEMRWALSYVVNRPKIGNVIWQPPTVPAVHPWSEWALLQKFIDQDVLDEYTIEYSPEKAIAILDGLGFMPGDDGIRVDDQGNRLSFIVSTPAAIGGGEYQIAQDLAEEAAKVGIELQVDSMQGGTYWDNLNGVNAGNFDLGSHWLCGTWMDPVELYQSYTGDLPIPGDGSDLPSYTNFIGLQNADLDDAVERIKVSSPDSPEAQAAYSDALRAWMQSMPVLPIVQTIYVMAWNQTYWTNWPVEDNFYTVPFTWWATFYNVTFELQPA